MLSSQSMDRTRNLVALLLQEGIAVATALLWIAKAGKLFVALIRHFRRQDLQLSYTMPEHGFLVTDSIHLPLAHKLAHHGSTFLTSMHCNTFYTTENPGYLWAPNALPISFTSGSTGEPQACCTTIRVCSILSRD
jgi:acyl-coenzyme A synthetase/AMP-(fatty) acid ligase